MKETGKFLGLATVVWIWAMILVIGGSLVGLAFYGVQLNLQRHAITESNAFIQTQIERLSTNYNQFLDDDKEIAKYSDNQKVVQADRADQMGIVKEMWMSYDQIPQDSKDAVPNDLLQFLNTHPRNWQP